MYLYILCLSVCMSGYLFIYLLVCLCPINAKRLNRSGPNFMWDLTWPQGRFTDDPNFKYLPNRIRFSLNLNHEFFLIKSEKFFCVFLLQWENVQIENHESHVIYFYIYYTYMWIYIHFTVLYCTVPVLCMCHMQCLFALCTVCSKQIHSAHIQLVQFLKYNYLKGLYV